MRLIAGIDIGKYNSVVSIVNENGDEISSKDIETDPCKIEEFFEPFKNELNLVLIESGNQTRKISLYLKSKGISTNVVDARHAAPFLREIRRNKTDKNDAFALAQLARSGQFRQVWIKSDEAVKVFSNLQARDQLIKTEVDLRNALAGHLLGLGHAIPRVHRTKFLELTRKMLGDYKGLDHLQDLLGVIEFLSGSIEIANKRINEMAMSSPACKLLMSVPGVGPITALWYRAVIDDPGRFRRSRDVGSFVGLVPMTYQSGNRLRSGSISRRGSTELRSSLFNAARSLRFIYKKECRLKSWALRVERRRGAKRGLTALARKLAVVMHSVWQRGEPYVD